MRAQELHVGTNPKLHTKSTTCNNFSIRLEGHYYKRNQRHV